MFLKALLNILDRNQNLILMPKTNNRKSVPLTPKASVACLQPICLPMDGIKHKNSK